MDAEELFPNPLEQTTAITTMPYELRPRFIGRKASVERLTKAFSSARADRELGFIVVIGEPGMGKSRLVKEATRAMCKQDPDTRVLTGEGDGRGVGFAAIGRLLSRRFGITAADAAQDQQEKIIAGVAEVLPAQRVTEVAHLIAHLMRVPFTDSPVVGPLVESPQQLEARTYIAMRRFLAADADQGPLVLCIENLELCGAETINLLHYLAAGLATAPVVIIGTARPSLYDKHPSFGEGDVPPDCINLGPLEDDEATKLLEELCRPLDTVPQQIIAHAT